MEWLKKILKRKKIDTIDHLYTPLSVAKREIARRSRDPKLQQKVLDYIDGNMLPCLVDGPRALLSRHVASPNYETLFFMELAKIMDLPPTLIEYTQDKFVDKNFCKYHLGRLFVEQGYGRNGGMKMAAHTIIDFNKHRGKKINDIETKWGENFVDFHHRLLHHVLHVHDDHVFDFSEWFQNSCAKSGDDFYSQYLALFVAHGVLFENFLLNEEEYEFTQTRVIPSFKKIEKLFGVKPLIVPIQPPKFERDPYWAYYPHEVSGILAPSINLKPLSAIMKAS